MVEQNGNNMIKIDLRLDNWNEIIKTCRANKYGANSRKKKEMQEISYFISSMPKIEKYPIKINFIWHIKNSNSDLDGKSCKSILDAMQQLGILKNDNIKHINEINYKAIKDEKEYVEIEVENGN